MSFTPEIETSILTDTDLDNISGGSRRPGQSWEHALPDRNLEADPRLGGG